MSVVLTVEDEPFVSEYLGYVLARAGYTVIAAADADEAIAILESRDDIRIVFTDINMPGSMDGLKLAAAVKDRWPPIELIIATGKAAPSKEEMPPGSLFIPKPYDAEQIIAAVGRFPLASVCAI